jgi:hypothetical protein
MLEYNLIVENVKASSLKGFIPGDAPCQDYSKILF